MQQSLCLLSNDKDNKPFILEHIYSYNIHEK